MNPLKILALWVGLTVLVPFVWAQKVQLPQKAAPPRAISEPIYSNNPILAMIDGEPIHLDEIMSKPIHDLLEELYATLQSELPKHALKKLALKHAEFQSNFRVAVTNEQIERFYKQNRLEKRGSLQDLVPQIKQYLARQAQLTYELQQYQKALKQGFLQSFLVPPPEFLVTASLSHGMLRANPKAPVMFLEFSDYQCPFCSRAQATVNQLMQKYEGKVAFGYRHFPLAFHKEADEAAIAVECAREQGKFEEMHKILYANQRQQHPEHLKAYARRIKVKDLKAFDQCLDQEKYRAHVQQDIQDGAAVGITGTPGFIIGTYDPKTKKVTGEVLSGALPLDRFDEIIQKYLKKKP